MNYLNLIDNLKPQYDLNKHLGTLTKANLIFMIGKNHDNPTLKSELKRCDNFKQMVNVIEQRTGELSKIPRSAEELDDFQDTLDRIIKFARL